MNGKWLHDKDIDVVGAEARPLKGDFPIHCISDRMIFVLIYGTVFLLESNIVENNQLKIY